MAPDGRTEGMDRHGQNDIPPPSATIITQTPLDQNKLILNLQQSDVTPCAN